jgi:membrane associated rhomboid family serine protease
MRHPPPLSTCLAYPITTSLAAFAIMATLQYWAGANISKFEIGLDDWWREPWRFLTPVLFHVNSIHLIFNLYWLWVFGSQIEPVFGSGKTLGIYMLLAAGPIAAEVAIFQGGIGLSGVGYGLFGLLWVLSRTDRRFQDSVDRQTVRLMVGWFFLCIFLTVTNVMPVANIAHGVGCILGILLGWTIAERNRILHLRNAAVLAAVFLLCIAGGTIARPYVNLSSRYGNELAYYGYVALKNGNTRRAISLYEKAVIVNSNDADWWHKLGCAYLEAGRENDAKHAFQKEQSLQSEDQ